jgi:hypothetical protein
MTIETAGTALSEGARILRPADAVTGGGRVRYTIATLVTDHDQYAAMLSSLRAGGFNDEDCEYLYIDNATANTACAYRGLNALLNEAVGEFVILCHQDIRLLTDQRGDLDRRLGELDRLDPEWALAGNAGGVAPGVLALRITDPHGADQNTGNLPQRVVSLDENFIVVRRTARVGFSRDLSGFHFYGADICLNAAIAGYTAYVIDFHLSHLSAGKKSAAFHRCEAAFRAKWERALSARWIQTTCALVRLSGNTTGQLAGRIATAPLARISRRLPKASGWRRAASESGA